MTIILGMISYNSFGQSSFTEFSLNAALNPHSQPNIHTVNGLESMDYHGSGTLGLVISQSDVDAANTGVYNYRLDVNGDLTINSADAYLIQQYVNGEIDYLPGHWNMLNGIEKRSWLAKYLNYSKTRAESIGQSPKWTCGYFMVQESISTFGIEGIPPSESFYNYSENGRWNIPMYRTAVKVTLGINPDITTNNDGHFVNATLVGPNTTERFIGDPLKMSNWQFTEPQLAKVVVPGDFSISDEGPVRIFWYGLYAPTGDYLQWQLVSFDLSQDGENGTKDHTELVLENPNKPVEVDTEAPVVTVENKTLEMLQTLDTSPAALGGYTVTDNTDPTPTVVIEDESTGPNYSGYVITRTITATDDSGNVGVAIQTITVVDTTPIVATGDDYEEFEYSTTLDLSSAATGEPTFTDNGAVESVTEVDESTQVMDGTSKQVNFVVTRTWTAKDFADNVTEFIKHLDVSDSTAPTGDFPENKTVEEGASTDPSVTGEPQNVLDNSNLEVTVEFEDTVTESEGGKTIERKWTLTDIVGISLSHVQTITVNASQPFYLTVTRNANNLEVKYFSKVDEAITIQVMNIGGGKMLKTQSTDVTKGSNTILIPLTKSFTFNLVRVIDSNNDATQSKSFRDF